MNPLFRVSRYLFRYKPAFFLTLVLALSSTAFLLAVPQVIRFVIDDIITRGDVSRIGVGLFIAFLCFLGRDLLNCIRIRINNVLEQKVLIDLRKDVHDKLLDLPVSYYEKRPSGEIASRVIEDVQNVERVILDGTEQGLVAVVTVVGVAIMLFLLQPSLALLVMIPLPLLAVLAVNHAKATRRNWKRVRESAGHLNGLLVEHLQGNRLISSFALRDREQGRFMDRATTLKEATLHAMFRWSFYSPGTSFLASMGIIAVLGYGGYLLINEAMTLGAFVGFYAYCGMFYDPINRLNQLNHLISAGKASGERVFEILDHEIEITNCANPKPFPKTFSDVRFDGVHFSYQDRVPLLEDLNLVMPAGKLTALVGHTGAGKSTIANLLLRYYDPTRGSVSIGGTDLREIDLQSLRSNIGHVAQDPFLFDGTVADNLLLAKTHATEEELWSALRGANAAEFVERMPSGIHTMIGERGIRLSQGEKQRLTIARVILRNPPLVILDEATSSVDTLTEFKIQSALDNLMRERTVLIIAHRLSTVRKADQIVVLEEGRIIERGTHDSLLEAGGHYSTLWRIQSDRIPDRHAIAR